jgi:hypothetical protein
MNISFDFRGNANGIMANFQHFRFLLIDSVPGTLGQSKNLRDLLVPAPIDQNDVPLA